MMSSPRLNGKIADPEESAKAVGLTYISSNQIGIHRKRNGNHFIYCTNDGHVLRDAKMLARIKSLAIPPAWTEVWICRDPNGHLQATGRDARRRKQHRYHPRWREVRDSNKYGKMVSFAKALPAIRSRVNHDLQLQGLPRNKVLAAVVKLLEISLVRVGNEEYARHNNSFGLTTMKDRHVRILGPKLRFQFRGKSGIHHEVDIEDKRLARIVKSCQELPGQDLFQYIDDNGIRQDVKSGDVNDYLREISGAEFSAKDFRTWAGTVLAANALAEFERFDSQAKAKKNIVSAIETVAKKLGNTVAICRKCYVHPKVIEAYLTGSLAKMLKRRTERRLSSSIGRLKPEEAAVLGLLQRKLPGERSLAASLRASLKKTKHSRFRERTVPERRNNSVSRSRYVRQM